MIIKTELSPSLSGVQVEHALGFVHKTGLVSAMPADWVRSLSHDASCRYRELVKAHREFDSRVPAQLALAEREVDLQVDRDVDVACVPDPTRFAGMPPQRPEYCKPELAFYSVAFDDFDRKRVTPIRTTLSPADVWREHFQGLAQMTRTDVAVVDRYAVKNEEGLRFVAEQLAMHLPPHVAVSVYTAIDSDHCPTWLQQVVRGINQQRIGQGGPKQTGYLHVYWSADRDFGPIAHRRFIRFGTWVCNLDNGLDVFRSRRSQPHPFSLSADWRQETEQESKLRQKSRRFVAHKA